MTLKQCYNVLWEGIRRVKLCTRQPKICKVMGVKDLGESSPQWLILHCVIDCQIVIWYKTIDYSHFKGLTGYSDNLQLTTTMLSLKITTDLQPHFSNQAETLIIIWMHLGETYPLHQPLWLDLADGPGCAKFTAQTRTGKDENWNRHSWMKRQIQKSCKSRS